MLNTLHLLPIHILVMLVCACVLRDLIQKHMLYLHKNSLGYDPIAKWSEIQGGSQVCGCSDRLMKMMTIQGNFCCLIPASIGIGTNSPELLLLKFSSTCWGLYSEISWLEWCDCSWAVYVVTLLIGIDYYDRVHWIILLHGTQHNCQFGELSLYTKTFKLSTFVLVT